MLDDQNIGTKAEEQLKPANRFQWLLARLRAGTPRRPEVPVPVDLAVAHAALTFLGLAILPRHPLAIPTAAGLAFIALVWVQLARNWRSEEPPSPSSPPPSTPRFRYDRYEKFLYKLVFTAR
jgi:hypothetical protein